MPPPPFGPALTWRVTRADSKHGTLHEVAKLEKIVVNMGVGDAARDSKVLEGAMADMAVITGQKPQVSRARKSIAQFKLEAVVTTVTSMPRTRSILSMSISWNTVCSVSPKV